MSRTDVKGLLRLAPLALGMGVVCAVLLIALSELAEALQDLIWTALPEAAGFDSDAAWWLVLVLTVAGAAVGLIVWKWPGGAGADPAAAELVAAPLPMRALPGIAATATIGLAAGVSLGPENPIVAICVAVVCFLGSRLAPKVPGPGWVGIAAAGTIGAMFGTPVAAALTLTESPGGDPDQPLWSKLFAPLLAAGSGALTMQVLGTPVFAVDLPAYTGLAWRDLLTAPAVAAVAALLGLAAAVAFHWSHRAFGLVANPMLRTTIGGLVLGLLAVLGGTITMFKGLDEMKELAAGDHGTGGLLLIVAVKILALVVAATCGFRGGRIFPIVFVGVALGLLWSHVWDGAAPALAVGCAVLGLTLAVTRNGWLSVFMAATVVGDIALLPLLCLAVLPAWLLVANAPQMVIDPAHAHTERTPARAAPAP
ncbi:ion channel protein [Glycomyces paridis]|uniref:Ion channel protein n=1 Tax=Glycomyces paridis TaxID=2126555 RepID=A0A4S8PM83_9ACTN|nr:ion channel protein [Glycomyces paridis]THV30845.1 ion channel protein [Glycomyces paridis]